MRAKRKPQTQSDRDAAFCRQTTRQYHAALRKNARIVARFVDRVANPYDRVAFYVCEISMSELDAMSALASYFKRATTRKKASRR